MNRLWAEVSGPGAFRLVLASLVFLHHSSSIALGGAAVYVFFMLSGYWICRMWHEKYKLCLRPYRTFAISRLWRLLPVFFVVNLAAFAVDLILPSGDLARMLANGSRAGIAHAVLSNIAILGYASAPYHPIGSGWSLDIELQFYLFVPLLLAMIRDRPLWLVLAGSLIITAASSVTLGANLTFTSYLFFFVAGICAAHWRLHADERLVIASLVLCAVLLLVLLLQNDLRPILLGGAHSATLHQAMNPALNVVVGILLAPYALRTIDVHGGRRDKMYADMSYALYLVHWIGCWILGWQFGNLPVAQRLPYFAATWIVVYAATWLVWRFVDQPMNRLRSRYVRRREAVGIAHADTPEPESPSPLLAVKPAR